MNKSYCNNKMRKKGYRNVDANDIAALETANVTCLASVVVRVRLNFTKSYETISKLSLILELHI